MTPNEKRLLINIGRHMLRVATGDNNALAKAIVECEIELHQTSASGMRAAPISPSGQHDEVCSCAFCR